MHISDIQQSRIQIFITCALSICSFFHVVAQTVVTGQVVDASSKETVPYTTVSVTGIDGKPVAEILSDADGQFSFAGSPGEYIIRYLFEGYQSRLVPLKVDNQNQPYNLGKIGLEQQKGLHGNISLTYGIGALTSRRADLPTPLGSYQRNPKFLPLLHFNYAASRISIFFTSEMIRQQWVPDNEFTDIYIGQDAYTSQVPDNRTRTYYSVQGGVSWAPNVRQVFSLSGMFNYESRTDTAQVGFFDTSNMNMIRYWPWKKREKLGLANITLNYRHKFTGEEHELNVTLQYTHGWDDELFRLYELSSLYIGRDTTHYMAKDHIVQLSAGYIKPLMNGRIEAGVKGKTSRMPSTYTTQADTRSVIYPGMGSRSEWGEDLVTLYATWLFQNAMFEAVAGLQAGYANINYDLPEDNIYYPVNDTYDYIDFLPDLKLTWKVNKHNSLLGFYNRTVDRPGELVTRFYPRYNDPGLIRSGNPYLRPQYTQNAGLEYKYTWKGGSIIISGYYKTVNTPFSRIFSMDEQSNHRSIVVRVFANTGKTNDIGAEATVVQQLGRRWRVTGHINGYNNRISAYSGTVFFPNEHDFDIIASTSNTWNAKIDNRVTIGKNGRLQFSGVYYAPRNIPQGRRYGFGGVNFEFRQPFAMGRLELTLSMTDILNTMGIKEEVLSDGFRAVYENHYETQTVSLAMKYRF